MAAAEKSAGGLTIEGSVFEHLGNTIASHILKRSNHGKSGGSGNVDGGFDPWFPRAWGGDGVRAPLLVRTVRPPSESPY